MPSVMQHDGLINLPSAACLSNLKCGMRSRKIIFATLLVAIYTVATLCSSLSVILCDHHHHHHDHTTHHHHNSAQECCCDCLTFEGDCCNHHHHLLGENHTDYIASTQRFDSRAGQSLILMLMPAVLSAVVGGLEDVPTLNISSYGGDEHRPLVAAFISHESLRAPPALA